jgi:hypothetical protein
MKKKLLTLTLLLSMTASSFAAPISTPNVVKDTPIISDVYSSCRTVDLTNATSDYMLKPCEEAIISFNNVASVPLHIATQNETYYEMHIISSNGARSTATTTSYTTLYPNNKLYSGAFISNTVWKASNNEGSSNVIRDNGFIIGPGFVIATAYITNFTQYKGIRVHADSYGSTYYFPLLYIVNSDWQDTTTPWTSLGTITFPQPTSGFVLVKRLR